jgi:antitoxin component YwqK of YwqJK toxin-antitoxin module
VLERTSIFDLHYQQNADDHFLCNADGSHYTGIVYEALANGYVTTEYEVKDGLKDGVEKEFYSDGVVEHLVHYRHGLLHGDVIYYYGDGTPKEKSVFEYDILLEEFEWDESGNLVNHTTIPVDDAKFQKAVRLRSKYTW